MKNLHITSILLIFSWTTLYGQAPFIDSSYIWTEAFYYPNQYMSFRHRLASESTTMNGREYKEILRSYDFEGENWFPTWIFLRYEDQKLYGGYSNGEILIFDYSLQIHDTFNSPDSPSFVVTQVDTIELSNGDHRKRLKTHCRDTNAWGTYPIYWIEGLGCTSSLVQYHSTCAFDAGGELMCMWKNDTLIYSNPLTDSCWIQPVSTGLLAASDITVFPNPVEDELTITDPGGIVEHVVLIDQLGRVITNNSTLVLPMSGHAAGVYFLQISLKSGHRFSRTIIKK